MSTVTEPPSASGIGTARPRIESASKVSGEAQYVSDVPIVGLLHGRMVLSPFAHARITSIDREAALREPGVRAVLIWEDLPIKGGAGRAAEPLARDEVVFAGQPVALVIADTEAHAEDAAEYVLVEYEPLDTAIDLRAAIEPDAPAARLGDAEDESDVEMHGGGGETGTAAADPPSSANVIDRKLFADGGVAAALEGSAAVASGSFRVPWIHQAYMEPQVATAWVEPDGTLSLFSSTQAVFWVRQEISRLFELSVDKVKVRAGVLGGGFGGKLRLIEPLVAGAALATGDPVRVAFTREEDFAAANPCPALEFDLTLGADADGRFTALSGRILIDCGAFTDSAPAALAGTRVGGPYQIDAWSIETVAVRTNRFGAGAYRGPTATQSTFALESLIDELSHKLGIDPIELRMRNCPETGAKRMDGIPWPPIGFRETLTALAESALWRNREQLGENEGVGLALGMFPGAKQGAGAVCRMDSDGGLTVINGYVDMTGTNTSIATIAAEVFGVSSDVVRVISQDTTSAPHAGVSGGSMVTYCLGSAVAVAAEDAKQQTLKVAAQEMEIDEADLEIVDGEVRPLGSPDRAMALSTIAAKVTGFGPYAPIEGHGSAVPPELAPSVAATAARVSVDFDTGEIRIVDYLAVQDVGRSINPALIEGQMRGGAAQSIGFALYEDLAHDPAGQLLAGSFMTYAVPRSHLLPAIETIIVEVPSPYGPLGARGMGESAMATGAAAVANAVAQATGQRFRTLPMTPQRVWERLNDPPEAGKSAKEE
jgi:CO/xanthine dehydrogenase Mo-binding subunit